MTTKQKINAAPKYVLFIEGAGYLSAVQNFLSGINFTEDINKAEKFAIGYDNPTDKAAIWNAEAKRMFNNSSVKFEVVNL